MNHRLWVWIWWMQIKTDKILWEVYAWQWHSHQITTPSHPHQLSPLNSVEISSLPITGYVSNNQYIRFLKFKHMETLQLQNTSDLAALPWMKKAMTRMRPELANLLIFSQLLKRVPLNPHFVCISTKEKREKWANNGQEREKRGKNETVLWKNKFHAVHLCKHCWTA